MDHSSEIKKEQLRKKLNKKRAEKGLEDESGKMDENSLFTMINQVNKTLQENPDMVKKINKCINNVFDNKDLMSSLISEVETNIVNKESDDSDDSDDSDVEDAPESQEGEILDTAHVQGVSEPAVGTILDTSEEKELPAASENESTQ
jgi:hypothetical protein